MNLSKKSLSYKYLKGYLADYEIEYKVTDTCSYFKQMIFATIWYFIVILAMGCILAFIVLLSVIYLPLIIDIDTLYSWGITYKNFQVSMLANFVIFGAAVLSTFCYYIDNLGGKFDNRLTNIKVLNGVINKFCTKITIVD